jgi:hypothetical protein
MPMFLNMKMDVGINKGANQITLQKGSKSFLVLFHFFKWIFLWMKSFTTCYQKYI